MNEQTASTASTGAAAAEARREPWRLWLAGGSGLGLVLLLVATWLWPLPPVRPGGEPSWWQWATRAQEQHAFRRLPTISADLSSVCFVDAQRGWAVGEGGTIVATRDGGATWQARAAGPFAWLESVKFVDAQRGWAVGIGGTIVATRDGGATWQAQAAGTSAWLESVQFVDEQRGWAVGAGGTIVATRDGGATWRVGDVFAYSRRPAPVLWIGLGGCLLGLLGSAFWPASKKTPRGAASIGELLISDRPLAQPGQAPESLRRLVTGLANYLGNSATAAPITLAITGRWGQGKSSVMNLLSAELARRGHRPVWFNAWHHQEAGNVLAAMLGAIREQAIPPLLTFPAHAPFIDFDGIEYRLRLAWRRAQRLLPRVILLHGVLALAVTWLVKHWEVLLALEWPDGPQGWWENLGTLVALGAVVAPLYKLWQLLRAFGIDPAKLLIPASGSAAPARELEALNVFRTRFAVEFAEVTAALGSKHRMVVFIDDLDRCTAAHLLQVLEATNFLNSSGECFIVLGMQRESVLEALKGQLEDSQLGPKKKPEDWLEKLVQVEVGVPSDTQALDHLLGAEEKPSRPASRWLRSTVLTSGALLVMGGLVWGGIVLGQHRWLELQATKASPPPPPPPYRVEVALPAAIWSSGAAEDGSTFTTLLPRGGSKLVGTYDEEKRLLSLNWGDAKAASTENTAAGGASKSGQAGSDRLGGPPDERGPAAGPVVSPGVPPLYGWSSIVTMALAGLGAAVLAVLALNRRYRVQSEDSEPFRDAMLAWRGLITELCTTPRELKRLLNRMRFDAMLVRSLQQKAPEGSAEHDPVREREGEIVALAVMEKRGGNPFTLKETPSESFPDAAAQNLALRLDQKDLAKRADAAEAAYETDPVFEAFRRYKESVRL